MPLAADACYRALLARDARFDGMFFVGVSTTGVYCRPVCHARTPRPSSCIFFARPAEAEREGFRACFRCRPERAPGGGVDDAVSRTVARAVARIEEGALDEAGLDHLARELGVTARHLRRCMRAELGVSPTELSLSRRLAIARELLRSTHLPVLEVAYASGFGSVRRFHTAFAKAHGRAPGALRRQSRSSNDPGTAVTVTLGFRPPLAWGPLLSFLEARAVRGVEAVVDGAYVRTARVGERRGWLRVRPTDGAALTLEVSASLVPVVMQVVARVRRLFDLDARPDAIDAHLRRDPRLAPLIEARPGLRVPGAFDPFETTLTALVGQQVTVRAAVTLAGRLVEVLGDPIETPFRALHSLWPTASGVANADVRPIARLGLPLARARAVVAVAAGVAQGELDLGLVDDASRSPILAVDGIGLWTAAYVAMRAGSWPDAFPVHDAALARALGVPRSHVTDTLASAWRPWRSYATLYLWTGLDP